MQLKDFSLFPFVVFRPTFVFMNMAVISPSSSINLTSVDFILQVLFITLIAGLLTY